VLAAIDIMVRTRKDKPLVKYPLCPEGFKEMGFDTGKSETPIIPLFIRTI
jgi:hypothetical protein